MKPKANPFYVVEQLYMVKIKENQSRYPAQADLRHNLSIDDQCQQRTGLRFMLE